MMKRYTEELAKLNETIQNERKNREESETAIYDMLKDVVSKVKAEIDTEKKERFEFKIKLTFNILLGSKQKRLYWDY